MEIGHSTEGSSSVKSMKPARAQTWADALARPGRAMQAGAGRRVISAW
jgi:hypothetical protein